MWDDPHTGSNISELLTSSVAQFGRPSCSKRTWLQRPQCSSLAPSGCPKRARRARFGRPNGSEWRVTRPEGPQKTRNALLPKRTEWFTTPPERVYRPAGRVPRGISKPSPRAPLPTQQRAARRSKRTERFTTPSEFASREEAIYSPHCTVGGNKSASSRWQIAKNRSGAAPRASVKRPNCTPCDRELRLMPPRHHDSNPCPVAHVRPGSSEGSKKPTKILPQLRRASSDRHPCGA